MFLHSHISEGCESSSSPIIMPLSLTLPVNGILNTSSSSASLSTNLERSVSSSHGLKTPWPLPSRLSLRHCNCSRSKSRYRPGTGRRSGRAAREAPPVWRRSGSHPHCGHATGRRDCQCVPLACCCRRSPPLLYDPFNVLVNLVC